MPRPAVSGGGFAFRTHCLRKLAQVDALLGLTAASPTGEPIREVPVDPAEFRNGLMLPGATGLVRYGDAVEEFQRHRYQDLDPDLMAVALGEKPPTGGRHWWEATKGASKDTDLALCLLWLLAYSERFLDCQVAAADREQAAELRKAAQGVLHQNEWLRDRVDLSQNTLLNRRTGSRAHIIPADPSGAHGARPDVLIINELHAHKNAEFARNLMDNARKVPNGIVVIATNAGHVGTWQWDLREQARRSTRWAFHRLDRPAPWIPDRDIRESEETNPPGRHKRLWYGVWQEGAEGAEWEQHPEYFGSHLLVRDWPDAFTVHVIAVDPSKGKTDRADPSAIVRVGVSGGLVWIRASIKIRPAEQIVHDLVDMAEQLWPDGVVIEENQFQFLLAPLVGRECEDRGLPPLPVALYQHTKSKDKKTRIRRLGPYLANKYLRIYDDPEGNGRELVKQLRNFGTDSDHDDGPDAAEMGIRLVNEIGVQRAEGEPQGQFLTP